MKRDVGSYWKDDDWCISFGITFWYHRHPLVSVCRHFHVIIDFIAWYIELTFGEKNPKEE